MGLLWLQLVSTFDQESETLSSLVVMVAEVIGWLVLMLALMYFVFAAGAWPSRRWAWLIGMLVSVLTILYLVSVLLRGGLVAVLFGLIVPVIMLCYLLSPTGRRVFLQE